MHASTLNSAVCPACRNTMRFVWAIPQPDGLFDLQSFECDSCRLALRCEAVFEVLEMAGIR